MTERVFFGECAVDIFVMKIADLPDEPIADAKREEYIARASDPDTRRERRAVWQLLDAALKSSRGVDLSEIEIIREECGRWTSPEVCFSLSHTQGAVAVAISDSPVGIDIEEIKERDITALSRRALTEREREELDLAPPEERLTRFYEIWCKKEAYFKTLGSSAFVPNKTDSTEAGAISRVIELDGKRLVLAVAVGTKYMEKDLPKRKKNRLENYDYSTSGAYFLTICTRNRKNIFWDKDQPDFVGEDIILPSENVRLSPYGKIAEEAILAIPKHYSHIELSQYVIMPNHVHMILFIPYNSGRMISSPTSILTAVGQMKRYVSKRVGTAIWQRSFHDHIIRDKNDYEKISRYIHENPICWQYDELYTEE